MKKGQSLVELQKIPGVGPKIAEELWALNCRSVTDLKNKDPEKLYIQLCAHHGRHIDRCVLYVFRCAVYYATHEIHDPLLLKWWHWKDENQIDTPARNRM